MRKKIFISYRRFVIFVLVFTLIITGGGITFFYNANKINKNYYSGAYIDKAQMIDNLILKGEKEKIVTIPIEEVDPKSQPIVFKITAYDLSVQSTGKTKSHPAYGISRSGLNLRGKSWDTARVVSVDPNLIPLGSTILIEFKDEKYKIYDGIYLASDTGIAIKGNIIDLFLGDFGLSKPSKEAMEFGVTYADVKIIKED